MRQAVVEGDSEANTILRSGDMVLEIKVYSKQRVDLLPTLFEAL